MAARASTRCRRQWAVALIFSGVSVVARAQLLPQDLSSCGALLTDPAPRTITLRGQQEAELEWRRLPAGSLLALIRERSIDVSVTPVAGNNTPSDTPVRREGTQVLFVPDDSRAHLLLRILAKDLPNVRGTVSVSMLAMGEGVECAQFVEQIAAGDREYGAAELLVRGGGSRNTERAKRSKNAAEAYAAAEAIAIRANWPALAGHAQLALAASNYQGHNDWAGSQSAALRATATFVSIKRDYFEARAGAMAAAAMLETGTATSPGNAYQEARGLLERAAQTFHSNGYVYDEALTRNNVGLSYLYASDFQRCITESQRAIPLFEKVAESHRIALARQNIALCQWGLGKIRVASVLLQQVIPLLKDAPLPIHYTTALNNGALAHFALGEFDRSILLHAEGERAAKEFAMPRERAQSLYGLGVTYAAIGDFETAEDFLLRSLKLRTAELDRRGRIASLRALASVLDTRREADDADRLDREALTLATNDLTRLRIEARLLERSIVARKITPELRKRVDELAEGVVKGDRLVAARARYLRALIASSGDDVSPAHADFEAAQRVFSELENIEGEYDACLAQAQLAHRRRDFARARIAIACAGRVAEQMRAQVLNPELRANVSQLRRAAADLEVQITVDDPEGAATRAARTLAVMERHRARLLDDYAAVDIEVASNAAGLRRMYDDLAAARSQLADSHTRGSADSDRAAELRRRVAEQRIAVFGAEEHLRTAGRAPAPGYLLMREDLRRLAPGTAMVEYWLGGTRAFAIVVTREGARLQELAASREIDALVRDLRSALSDVSGSGAAFRLTKMREISALVFAPLQLSAATSRVIFVPDGSLHYVPMPALCLPGADCARMAVESYAVANAPSINRLLRAGSGPAQSLSRVLIVADPVYQASDPRLGVRHLSQSTEPNSNDLPQVASLRIGNSSPDSLRRLPGTAIEARLVAEKFPAADVDLLVGLRATRDTVLALDLARYGVIHFAVHGLSDDELPQLSALALTRYTRDGRYQDGRLWAGDLLRRRFNARLVFLSACETALGPQFSGEGLVGLKYVLLARGARNVISSLWPVEDVMTSGLVADVYARMRKGEPVDAALTGSQRDYLAKNSNRDIRDWAAWSVSMSSTELP